MGKYTELKDRQQTEVNEFPLGFAFGQEQFDRMMREWGLNPEDTDKIYSIGGGGFVRKSDADAMHEMFARHEAERKAMMNDDDYLYDMFRYELANHEYGYTYDVSDTLDALGLTLEQINTDKKLSKAFDKALKKYEEC